MKALSGPESNARNLLKRSQTLVAWLAIVTSLLVFAAYWTSSQHVSSVAATLESEELISKLDELLSTIQDAETGQRGYLLTGSGLYLTPFVQAQGKVEESLATVSAMASREGVPVSRMTALRSAIIAKMQELQLTVDLQHQGSPQAALAEVRTGRGQESMSQIRQIVQELKAEQTAVFRTRYRKQRKTQNLLAIVLSTGVLLAFSLLVFAYRFSVLYVRDRDRVEQEMKSLNDQLERRVQERTGALALRTRESELRAAELQRSNADLAQFASIASHDLQEPLRMVASYMALLSRRYKGALDETADTYIEFAIGGATRMQALVNDLLAYSRAGTQAIEKVNVPFELLLERALENLRLIIQETSAAVRYGSLPEVEADVVKVTQVLQNLIGNAIKFRKPDIPPQIDISGKPQGSNWLFEISDNGIGFDPKYCDRIFQVFQRLHGMGKYPGNGIGLAICRRIIEHHGGRLWAESQPDIGSTFFFTLPATNKVEGGASDSLDERHREETRHKPHVTF